MAHSYTPGLTVTETAVLRKRRLLPIPGTVTVKTGDQVQANTVVARTELAGKVHVVNVANLLGAAPDEIRDYLTKKEGETITRDEVIAESKPLIKWFRTEIRSPIAGKLESVSLITGQVLLREPPKALELLAYVDGTVVEELPGQGVTVECTASFVQGIFGIGGETWGELAMAVRSPDEQLTPGHLQPSMKGKIVVGGSFLGADTMAKAREIGVAALVVGGIHDKDLRELLGYDLGVAITGTERIGFTLVITEGFGVIPMAAKTFALLATHEGQKASISGATQIRAGVIRPEIIIPKPAKSAAAQPSGKGAEERAGIQAGDQVRVIRDPLFGRIGNVKSLPTDLRLIETESHVRVLEVGFADGSSTVIPRANVELIEG
ncbi:MAG: hypothetical protein EPO61_14440 [Nitrospirae bacterium]|nr:MAG: hypothetical protein EPO61_14440 [Nitrospirota bacterium]